MRYPSISWALAFAFATFITAVSAAPERRFTVQDSIERSVFVPPSFEYSDEPVPSPVPRVSFSPDGKHFAAVTMRGDLTIDKRVATIWLFDAHDVRVYLAAHASGGFPNAKVLARMASASNRWPISSWRWSSDSRSVFFLAADDDGAKHLYRATIGGGAAIALSRPDQSVDRYDERNGFVAYLTHPRVSAGDLYEAGGPSVPDVVVGTGKNILPLVFPAWADSVFSTSWDELWKIDNGQPVAVMDTERGTPVRLKDSRLVIAPDGRHALVTPMVEYIPPSWERYKPAIDAPGFYYTADTPATKGITSYNRPKQYAVINLISGKLSLLVDSPIELFAPFAAFLAQWSPDGSHIALLGAYPPLSTAAGLSSKADSIPACKIMVVVVRTKEASCAQTTAPAHEPMIVGLEWRQDDQEFVATYVATNTPDQTTATLFTHTRGTWISQILDQSVSDKLSVEVRQALNEPPTLVGRVGNEPAQVLLDPNPQLSTIALGNAVMYHWRDADGDVWSGALVTPPDFSRSRRYPLVIQTHGLDASKFLVEGPSIYSASGFAARSLAARNIVVLQVAETDKYDGTYKESEAGAAGYRAAIKQLASEGIVDPTKVGIHAWSHYGFYAMQGLIDDPHTYAATSFVETSTVSYSEYLMNIDYMGTDREKMFQAQIGAKPFGAGLKLWLERSSSFHYDRVCAPALFEFNSPPALIYGWADYAALRAQDKPVDLLYIRNGNHAQVKPRERLAEQSINVDWFDYWLNGHKDPNPSKVEQYKRWDAMKTLPRCAASAAHSMAGS
ncbi:MAG: hypothetical protein ACREPQ_16860 [Rhodanobacter sp.]